MRLSPRLTAVNARGTLLFFLWIALACREKASPTGAEIYGRFADDGRSVSVVVNLRFRNAPMNERRAIPGRIEVDLVTFADEAVAVIAPAGEPLGCRATADVAAAHFAFGQFEARLPVSGACRRPPEGRTAFTRFVFRNEVGTYHDFGGAPASLGGNGLAPGATARRRAQASSAVERASEDSLRAYLEELAALKDALPASHAELPACGSRAEAAPADPGASPLFAEGTLTALSATLRGGEGAEPRRRELDPLGDISDASVSDLHSYIEYENRQAPMAALATTFGPENPRFRIVRVLDEEMPRYTGGRSHHGRREVRYSAGRFSAVLFVVSRAEREILCAASISVEVPERSDTLERDDDASSLVQTMFRARVRHAIESATPSAPE